MKLIATLLPLAAIGTAFIIPDERMAEQAFLKEGPLSITKKLQGTVENAWSSIDNVFKDAIAFSENALDNAIHTISNSKATFECHASMTKWDIKKWLDAGSASNNVEDVELTDRPHKKPKHFPHHGHGPHHKPNLTVYQLISGSKYTTKFAKLIDEFPEFVEKLNGTSANFTVFAPIDKAFEKLPKHDKPPKELIEKVLKYHFSPEFYPAARIFTSHTIPTALKEESLGGEPQRIRITIGGFRGLFLNFYSKIVAINVFGTNGVIHGVDSLLLPPPPALKIIDLLPTEFSTFQLGLIKTGLFDAISDAPHTGGTLFAPSNLAFKKLGPKINAFLFSKYGEKYLKALLKYHIVANQTLYSDTYYKAKSADGEVINNGKIPQGHFHIDLPTLLNEKSLSIDTARWGGFITIKINGFNSIAVQDGIAKDGVIHVVSSILIPPKTPGGTEYMGEEMSVEEFKARLDSSVNDNRVEEL